MIAEKMKKLVNNSSAIRAMFEEGRKWQERAAQKHCYDFSLGNPRCFGAC